MEVLKSSSNGNYFLIRIFSKFQCKIEYSNPIMVGSLNQCNISLPSQSMPSSSSTPFLYSQVLARKEANPVFSDMQTSFTSSIDRYQQWKYNRSSMSVKEKKLRSSCILALTENRTASSQTTLGRAMMSLLAGPCRCLGRSPTQSLVSKRAAATVACGVVLRMRALSRFIQITLIKQLYDKATAQL